jgi:hypothetical protein
LLLLFDQFEEIFRFLAQGSAADADAFVALLLASSAQREVPIYVVLTMRSDFLGDCARFRDLPEAISDSQYLIPRLTRDELRAVITGPIGVRGGRIAPSLLQRLLNDVGDDMDQLPCCNTPSCAPGITGNHDGSRHRPDDLERSGYGGGLSPRRRGFETLATRIADRRAVFKCLTERGPDNREIRRPTPLCSRGDRERRVDGVRS